MSGVFVHFNTVFKFASLKESEHSTLLQDTLTGSTENLFNVGCQSGQVLPELVQHFHYFLKAIWFNQKLVILWLSLALGCRIANTTDFHELLWILHQMMKHLPLSVIFCVIQFRRNQP